MSSKHLAGHAPTERELDPLWVLGTLDLEPTVVDIMTRFGGESRETALIERIFFFDENYDLVWKTQFHADFESQPEIVEHTLQWGLLALFAPSLEWVEHDDFETFEHAFWRWQQITRTLRKLGDVVQPVHPWLYGWAMLGVDLFSQFCAMRLDVWNKRLARAAARCPIDARVGKVWADELPRSIDELRALKGVGDATILRVENELIEMLLRPDVERPS
jgi:hypothetical protein